MKAGRGLAALCASVALALGVLPLGPPASADAFSKIEIDGRMDFYNTPWDTHGGPFRYRMSCFFLCLGTFSEELTGTRPDYYVIHRMRGILVGFVAEGATAEHARVDSIFIGVQQDKSSGKTLPFPTPTVQDKKFEIDIGSEVAHFAFTDGANGTMPAGDVRITP